MTKLLLLLGCGVLIWWYLRVRRRAVHAARSRPLERPVERMVGCAYCGVNQPLSECVPDGNRFYCSEAHRRLAGEGGK